MPPICEWRAAEQTLMLAQRRRYFEAALAARGAAVLDASRKRGRARADRGAGPLPNRATCRSPTRTRPSARAEGVTRQRSRRRSSCSSKQVRTGRHHRAGHAADAVAAVARRRRASGRSERWRRGWPTSRAATSQLRLLAETQAEVAPQGSREASAMSSPIAGPGGPWPARTGSAGSGDYGQRQQQPATTR